VAAAAIRLLATITQFPSRSATIESGKLSFNFSLAIVPLRRLSVLLLFSDSASGLQVGFGKILEAEHRRSGLQSRLLDLVAPSSESAGS
jgi:hypothetical protein